MEFQIEMNGIFLSEAIKFYLGVIKKTLSESQVQSVLNIQRVFDEEECKAEPG